MENTEKSEHPGFKPLVTKGIRANGNREFSFVLDGKAVYQLLRTLETVAIENKSFLAVREAVLLWNQIDAQLKAQGF